MGNLTTTKEEKYTGKKIKKMGLLS